MPVRGKSMVPSTASRVLVKVREYGPDRLGGVAYNPYLDKSFQFRDIMEFTNRLDEMFDAMAFPQATVDYRRFKMRRRPKAQKSDGKKVAEEVPDNKEQLSAKDSDVFLIHVQFRQNATWQGTIKCAGQNEEKRFRSTLEMLKIMDSVLDAREPGEGFGTEG